MLKVTEQDGIYSTKNTGACMLRPNPGPANEEAHDSDFGSRTTPTPYRTSMALAIEASARHTLNVLQKR